MQDRRIRLAWFQPEVGQTECGDEDFQDIASGLPFLFAYGCPLNGQNLCRGGMLLWGAQFLLKVFKMQNLRGKSKILIPYLPLCSMLQFEQIYKYTRVISSLNQENGGQGPP